MKYQEGNWIMSFPKIQGRIPCGRIEFAYEHYKPLKCIVIAGG